MSLPSLWLLKDVIKNDDIRNQWYAGQLLSQKKGLKGNYAYGDSKLKVTKTAGGWKYKNIVLPDSTQSTSMASKRGKKLADLTVLTSISTKF